MGSHRLVHPPQTGPEPIGRAQSRSEQDEGLDISINAWRIVMILALLAAIAAAVLVATGFTGNTDSAPSYGGLGRAAVGEPVV
jgi:anti-sigma-K factor RskA